jgi:hypothetical protein
MTVCALAPAAKVATVVRIPGWAVLSLSRKTPKLGKFLHVSLRSFDGPRSVEPVERLTQNYPKALGSIAGCSGRRMESVTLKAASEILRRVSSDQDGARLKELVWRQVAAILTVFHGWFTQIER